MKRIKAAQGTPSRGQKTQLRSLRTRSLNPSPSGRGAGVRVGKLITVVSIPDPHPALRATFSRREKGRSARVFRMRSMSGARLP